jgi:hypothetical protein
VNSATPPGAIVRYGVIAEACCHPCNIVFIQTSTVSSKQLPNSRKGYGQVN